MQGMCVWFIVRELRSHILQGSTGRKKKTLFASQAYLLAISSFLQPYKSLHWAIKCSPAPFYEFIYLFLFGEARSGRILSGSPLWYIVPPLSALLWTLPCQHQRCLDSLHGPYCLTHSTDWIHVLSVWKSKFCWFCLWAVSQMCPYLLVPHCHSPR